MSQRLHWCYNDYMAMPITQLMYWINKDSESEEKRIRYIQDQHKKLQKNK